jgi:hypothetical protein
LTPGAGAPLRKELPLLDPAGLFRASEQVQQSPCELRILDADRCHPTSPEKLAEVRPGRVGKHGDPRPEGPAAKMAHRPGGGIGGEEQKAATAFPQRDLDGGRSKSQTSCLPREAQQGFNLVARGA